jgi:large subunit ribosomal protein L22
MAAVEERTSVRAEARYVRTAPRKAQLVAEEIRGRPVPEARTILAFMTRDAARDIEKVLSSAVANAEANHGLDGDELYVSAATVGAGPTLKRWRARARGRVARIKRRTCHITIALALPEEQVIRELLPKPTPAAAPASEPEAEAVEETVEKEAPKPKRAPRKKAETAETAEEKPKPRRAPRKKAETTAEAKAEEKPKRTPSTKPKPTRSTKPKAEAGDKPKPKTTRKKKAEDS